MGPFRRSAPELAPRPSSPLFYQPAYSTRGVPLTAPGSRSSTATAFWSVPAHSVDIDRVGLPTDEYVAVPVRNGAHDAGHFLLTTASHVARPTREQRRVAVLLADQVPAIDVRS